MQVKTHVYEELEKVITMLRKTIADKKQGMAVISANYGTGKTEAAKMLTKQYPDVYYMKISQTLDTPSKFTRELARTVGSAISRSYQETLDFLATYLEATGQNPIIILDESQRILKSSLLMSELKDLSEDNQIRFSYIFLGDHTTADIFKAHKHSIHKRILIKEKLQNLTEEIITEIAKEKGLQVDPNTVLEYGKERGWTTIEVAFLFSYLSEVSKVKKIEITKETIQEISKKLWKE